MTNKYIVPSKNAVLQNDTISSGSSTMAYYFYPNDSITINVKPDAAPNKYPEPLIAHEDKHRQTEKSGVMNKPMSLAQYSKLNLYDEISANITELLYVRQLLIDKPNEKEAIKKEYNYCFSFYFEALEKGDIKLNSTNPKEFEKEMAFIGRQTQNMWITYYAPSVTSYLKGNVNNMKTYLKTHNYEQIKDNPINYNNAKKEMLTIGGIDFTKYIPDLQLSNNTASKADQMISDDFLRNDVEKAIGYWSDVNINMNHKLSATQQYNIACHKFFAENVILRYCRHMNLSNSHDKKLFKEHVNFRIDNFEEVLNKNPKLKKEWEDKKKDFAKQICAENAITPFNKEGNDVEFQKELTRIYTFQDLNILNYSKNKNNLYKLLPNHTIPQEISDIDAQSTIKKYWNYALDLLGMGEEKPTYSKPKAPKLSAQQKQKNRKATHVRAKAEKPIYHNWSPNKRVSKVMNVKIYDFSQPFLKDHLDNLKKEQNKKNDKKVIKKTTNTKKLAQTEEYINIDKNGSYYWITKEEYEKMQQDQQKLIEKIANHNPKTIEQNKIISPTSTKNKDITA